MRQSLPHVSHCISRTCHVGCFSVSKIKNKEKVFLLLRSPSGLCKRPLNSKDFLADVTKHGACRLTCCPSFTFARGKQHTENCNHGDAKGPQWRCGVRWLRLIPSFILVCVVTEDKSCYLSLPWAARFLGKHAPVGSLENLPSCQVLVLVLLHGASHTF